MQSPPLVTIPPAGPFPDQEAQGLPVSGLGGSWGAYPHPMKSYPVPLFLCA